jgi:hypothetical protein
VRTIHPTMKKFAVLTLHDFPMFAPDSGGPFKARTSLTVQTANQIFPYIVQLINVQNKPFLKEPTSIKEFINSGRDKLAATSLKHLFDKHGSDKGVNGYHDLYGSILQTPDQVTDLLEIGLGIPINFDIVSNPRTDGRPGASLRAFKEFLPHATIIGADIDKRILLEEPRIQTFFVDQTDLQSLYP